MDLEFRKKGETAPDGPGGSSSRALSIAITSAHAGVGYSAKSHPCRDKEIHHGFSCLQDHSSYWHVDLKCGRRGADGGGTSSRHGAQSQMVQSHGNSGLHQGRKDCSMAGFCRPWFRSRVTFASGCGPSAWKQGPGRSIGEYLRGHRLGNTLLVDAIAVSLAALYAAWSPLTHATVGSQEVVDQPASAAAHAGPPYPRLTRARAGPALERRQARGAPVLAIRVRSVERGLYRGCQAGVGRAGVGGAGSGDT
jgi:hypothetical protein